MNKKKPKGPFYGVCDYCGRTLVNDYEPYNDYCKYYCSAICGINDNKKEPVIMGTCSTCKKKIMSDTIWIEDSADGYAKYCSAECLNKEK